MASGLFGMGGGMDSSISMRMMMAMMRRDLERGGGDRISKFAGDWATQFMRDHDYNGAGDGSEVHEHPHVYQMKHNLAHLPDTRNVCIAHGEYIGTWASTSCAMIMRVARDADGFKSVIPKDKVAFITRADHEVAQLLRANPNAQWIDIDIKGRSEMRMRRPGHQPRKKSHGGDGTSSKKRRLRGRKVDMSDPAALAAEQKRASRHRALVLVITLEIQVCACPMERHKHVHGESAYPSSDATDSDDETGTDSDQDSDKGKDSDSDDSDSDQDTNNVESHIEDVE